MSTRGTSTPSQPLPPQQFNTDDEELDEDSGADRKYKKRNSSKEDPSVTNEEFVVEAMLTGKDTTHPRTMTSLRVPYRPCFPPLNPLSNSGAR